MASRRAYAAAGTALLAAFTAMVVVGLAKSGGPPVLVNGYCSPVRGLCAAWLTPGGSVVLHAVKLGGTVFEIPGPGVLLYGATGLLVRLEPGGHAVAKLMETMASVILPGKGNVALPDGSARVVEKTSARIGGGEAAAFWVPKDCSPGPCYAVLSLSRGAVVDVKLYRGQDMLAWELYGYVNKTILVPMAWQAGAKDYTKLVVANHSGEKLVVRAAFYRAPGVGLAAETSEGKIEALLPVIG